MRSMTIDLQEILRELSELYDAESHNSYVTLYYKTDSLDKKFIERREKACQSILKGEEKRNFIETMNMVNDFLKNNKTKNIALFASYKNKVLQSVPLPVEVDNELIVDSSPYIRPLARIQDEWESFTLVLLSSNYAKIFSLSLGEIQDEKNLSKDIMNRHKKGGCSQARFQRLRKGAIHAFFTEVIEALETIADKRIILAGPGTSKIQFNELLPKYLSERVVDVIDINIDDEHELVKESLRLISEKEDQKSHEAVQQLREEILKGGLAVYGSEETLQAVKNGQVELLIVEKDFKLRGWVCEHCQVVRKGSVHSCPFCEGLVSEVDVIEEIIEFAERTDADIEFTDDEEIAILGHVGALLRFK